MKFWDSSAVVPLLIEEAATGSLTAELESDVDVVVWWGTEIDCLSALVRREREGSLAPEALVSTLGRLDELARAWLEIQPHASLRDTARRLIRVHPLRAADSLQLAAAIAASEGQPQTLPFVTLDERLALAADREGFSVIRAEEVS